MEILDIIRRAAANSGAVPSFNLDECPGDIEAAGLDMLLDQVLPAINCDRTLDVSTTAAVYTPENYRIELKPLELPDDTIHAGTASPPFDMLTQIIDGDMPVLIAQLSSLLGMDLRTEWPLDDLGNRLNIGVWSSDFKYVYLPRQYPVVLGRWYDRVNVPFPPMRVDAVMRETDRAEYCYRYRREFESAVYHYDELAYTIEEHSDKLVLIFHDTTPKILVLPVPLFFVNTSDNPHVISGYIEGPPKFRQYIIDALAVRYALRYGLGTADMMHSTAAMSYNLLLKNAPEPRHRPDARQQIGGILGRRRGRGYGIR